MGIKGFAYKLIYVSTQSNSNSRLIEKFTYLFNELFTFVKCLKSKQV